MIVEIQPAVVTVQNRNLADDVSGHGALTSVPREISQKCHVAQIIQFSKEKTREATKECEADAPSNG